MPSLTIEANDLKRALAAVKPAVARRSTIPILSCVRIEAMGGVATFESNDLERAIRIEIPATGDASCCLDFGKLSAFASMCPDGGAVRMDGDSTASLCCGKLSARIGALPLSDFPAFNAVQGRAMVLAGSLFRSMISRVERCRERDGRQAHIAGIHVALGGGRLCVEATDGRMLARAWASVEDRSDADFLLPGEMAAALAGIPEGDVTVIIDGGVATFASGAVTIASRLIDAQYPDLGRVIGAQTVAGDASEFDAAALKAAVQAASVSQTWDSECVTIAVTADGATITGSGGSGEGIVIPVDCDPGAPFEFSVNPDFLIPVIGAAGRKTITLAASSSGLVFTMADHGFTGIVAKRQPPRQMQRAA